MIRRFLLIAGTALATLATAAGNAAAQSQAASQAAASPGLKTFRWALLSAETGFDPVKISDLYSRYVTTHLFEALVRYDYLARPFKVRAEAAAAMPEVSADFRTYTFRIRPGVYFQDDPAFKGQRRELVAQDFVYAIKRFFDPANASPNYAEMNDQGFIGLDELRQQALAKKTPFDYDKPVEGLRALDRHTLQIKLESPRPRLLFTLADSSLYGAVAREVVEFYGDKTMEHPVGTGPFRLATWRRSSQIVLERNPGFHEAFYDAEPNADDAEGQALLQRFKGRRLPMIDRVEISIIEESQPRWLAFLNGETDLVTVPLEFANQAVPNGKLAPNLAKRGIQMQRVVNPDRTLYYFNMEDPTVGGYTADKVALRRAIRLAIDVTREINGVRRGQAIPAQSMVAPGTFGYDPNYKTENSDYNVPRAKALLDMYGYVDRNGDGWRDMPDGSPLVIQYATSPDSLQRQFDELWKRNMDAIGVRVEFKPAQWPENLKAARAGQLMVWQLGYTASTPDVQDAMQLLYGPGAGGQNLGRFRNERFDAIYDRMRSMPDGPERLALLDEANRIVTALAPHKYNVHRIVTDLAQPWIVGYRRPVFVSRFWQYLDIDESRRVSH
ncbi:ABC transporter substrate-binding protein [Rhizobacter sp. OV335]|uniref:ABC transporter substrate-binding protein n=1 Tax=Rhizobacter sp. OV335 TaxID=1500264 RepID=UPI00091510DA|nr:ABC transporter substrate-binding protein [Rhizobacter sp. OV335]SHN00773.1 ABC-type transport system, substrate-binding protein [Rhizobacter sp. OV335]